MIEKIVGTEIPFDYKLFDGNIITLGLDLIVLRTAESANEPARFENFVDAHVQGGEMETRVDITKDSYYVFMNYTFQNPEDNHGNDLPSVAQRKGNFGVNVHCWKYINTNLSSFISGTRSREDDDPRDDLPAYALLNLSIIAKEFFKTMVVQGTVFNLLDMDYSAPRGLWLYRTTSPDEHFLLD